MVKILPPPYKNGPNLNRPTKMPKLETPIHNFGIYQTSLYNKMAFSRPPIQQNGILETTYKKLHFRPPYTKITFVTPPHFQME